MKVLFFERHRGILGAGIPLPEAAAIIADRYEGSEGEPAAIVAELQRALPDSKVDDVPRGPQSWGGTSEFGMITLRIPAQGYPAHSWRVLKYSAGPPTRDGA